MCYLHYFWQLSFSRLGIGWWFWAWHYSRGSNKSFFSTQFEKGMDAQWQLYAATSTTGDEQPPDSGPFSWHTGHMLPYNMLQSYQLCAEGKGQQDKSDRGYAWMGLGTLD